MFQASDIPWLYNLFLVIKDKIMKTIIFFIAIMAIVSMISCEKEDMAANKLHSDSGLWEVNSIEYYEYDTLGNVLVDSVIEDVGTFIFFHSESLSALYGYYQGVFLSYADNAGYTMEYMIDKKRVDIKSYSGPYNLGGLYTVDKFGNHKQVWVAVTLHALSRYPNTMKSKQVITMKEKMRIN